VGYFEQVEQYGVLWMTHLPPRSRHRKDQLSSFPPVL